MEPQVITFHFCVYDKKMANSTTTNINLNLKAKIMKESTNSYSNLILMDHLQIPLHFSAN